MPSFDSSSNRSPLWIKKLDAVRFDEKGAYTSSEGKGGVNRSERALMLRTGRGRSAALREESEESRRQRAKVS